MRNSHPFRAQVLLLILLITVGVSSTFAQEEEPPPRLDVVEIMTEEFPLVRLRVISTDGSSNRAPLPSDAQIFEDDIAVTGFGLGENTVGSEIIFVIDANASSRSRDDASGLSRLEKIRASIVLFASEYMNDSRLDKVSIVVPDGDQVRFLLDDAVFPNEVINEINFYEPEQIGETPLNDMMLAAIDKAASNYSDGRFQAVVLFSDAGPMGDQLDYDTLTASAQEINLPIFGAILGAQADTQEIANMEGLTLPTRASYLHMPQPEEIVPFFTLFQDNATQHVLEYRSQLNSSGTHTIQLSSSAGQDSVDIELEISPPGIELAIDNSAPIIRVAEAHDSELTEANPTSQPVAARILWPDGRSRTIVEASLLVNGVVEQTTEEPEISEDGLVSFEWDISALGDGDYNLVVAVTDDLGLAAETEPLPVSIAVDVPEPPVATVEIPLTATEVSVPETEPESDRLLDNVGTAGIVIGVLAMIFAVVLVIFAIVLVRRRQQPAQAAAAASTAPTAGGAPENHDATQVIRPAFASKQAASAYLEPIENAPDHQGNIPVSGQDVPIGRDPKLVQIVFSDKSVSRLHARIIQKGSGYQLYDEGSASGTYLNYEQLSLEPEPLRDNDDVHIGRVHLRFRITSPVGDEDATQVMQAPPGRQSAASQPAAAETVDEDTSTQPYMPHSPQQAPRQPAPDQADDQDEDDISTQPYMPHSPKR